MKTFEEVHAVAKALWKLQLFHGDIFILTEDEHVRFSINCSDQFFWGCADMEEIEAEDLPLLWQTYEDLKALNTEEQEFFQVYVGSLFVARKRKQRPQGACYKGYPKKTWPLFHACGPHRSPELGNPYATPELDGDVV